MKNERNIINAVLAILKNKPTALFNYKQIKAKIDFEIDSKILIKTLEQLAKENRIGELGIGKYHWINSQENIEGIISFTNSGYAFLIPEDKNMEDIFISERDTFTAMDGDIVLVKIFNKKKKTRRQEGEVIEVIKRKRAGIVGLIITRQGQLILEPDNKKINFEFLIADSKNYLADIGKKAIGKILEWNNPDEKPEVEILSVLGLPGENDTEMHAIAADAGFMESFPAKVDKEADAISDEISKDEIKKREDFRNTHTFTIDPFDAKDFDDAISYKKIDENLTEIGVHIADVSHYVKENSAIDEESEKRATSVYLVDRTFPMLPERLSNNLCSLRPNEDKLTYSVIFEITDNAEIKNYRIVKTIIHSDKRYAYEDAQEIIEAKKEDEESKMLMHLNNIALKLREKRFKKGAINFETDEVKFKLDAAGKPIDVVKKIRKDAHKLIEEYMLLANKYVAQHIENYVKEEPVFIYRVHDEPNADKLLEFNKFAKQFGYKINTDTKNAITTSINKLIDDVEGKPEQNLIQSMAIRTMAKAIYSTYNTGHYGLAFDFYSHFTSPIRRYPDLMAHRLLFKYAHKQFENNVVLYEKRCKHCSMQEQKAAEAERNSIKYKQAEYMMNFIGKEFEAIISGVTEWGIYAEIIENKCEGLIRLNAILDDYYQYEPKEMAVVGKRLKKKYRLGDKIKVRIKNSNPAKMAIDLQLLGRIS